MSQSQPISIRVTFIGGPAHGTEELIERPADTIWHTLPNGQVAAYARRRSDVGIGNSRAVYAPVGMSESVYAEFAASYFKVPRAL